MILVCFLSYLFYALVHANLALLASSLRLRVAWICRNIELVALLVLFVGRVVNWVLGIVLTLLSVRALGRRGVQISI